MSEESAQPQEEKTPSEKAAEAPKAPPKAKPASGGDAVVLNGHIEIDLNKPLPKYDVGDVKAYAARNLKGNENCFVLICEPYLVPRVKASEAYPAFVNSSLPTLVGRGTVFWPPAGQERYVMAYKDILGNRMIPLDKPQAMGWKQEQVLEVVVKPMVGILQDFQYKDFVHGSIMPANMFDGGGGKNVNKVLLGDGLSAPCSYAQPALYQTIDRGMASPLGREMPTAADDLYALGVSIAVFMRAHDPMSGFDDEQMIRQKMELGSYGAVTGKDRFKGSILELLRGLLHDDPLQRWTVEEVLLWLDGNRLSPKQATRVKKAPRPLSFNEKKYFYLPFFAMDLYKNPPELHRVVENEELQQWLSRAFEDDEAVERLEKALQESSQGGKGSNYNDTLVANVSMALDLTAPLRYKGVRVTPSGFGNVLAQAMIQGKDVNPYVEILSGSMMLNLVAFSTNPNLDKGALFGRFEDCRNFLRQIKVGYGIERCLYILAPEVHCLSDKLKNYHVRSPEDMVMAFEDLCSKGQAPALFLDRHSIAYLSIKDSKCIDSFLYDLGSGEEHKRVLANLKSFSVIQQRAGIGKLLAMAQAFVEMLPCVFQRYHDQKIREQLEKNIQRFAKDGDLVKMAGLLDNAEVVTKDFEGFKGAMVEYKALNKEMAGIEKRLEDKDSFGKQTGKEFAAIASSAIAGVIILGVTFMFLTGQSIF